MVGIHSATGKVAFAFYSVVLRADLLQGSYSETTKSIICTINAEYEMMHGNYNSKIMSYKCGTLKESTN